MIRQTVIYTSELWVINKNNENKLSVWKRKVLRKIYGGKEVGNMWWRRSNREIMDLYGEPSIVNVIKCQRLRWLGHMWRLNNNRVVKKVFSAVSSGKKRRGRPREKWFDSVQRDLQNLNIKDWKSATMDKQKWRKTVNEAMGLLGL